MEKAHTLDTLARAIFDRLPVDWERAEETSGTAEERDAVRQLRVIAEIAALHRAEQWDSRGDTMWGPFRILERVGHGSYGDVFRAVDTRLDREIALKLLRSDDDTGAVTIEEARLLARVQHSNIVTIHGADRIDGRVGLWMEFLKGRTLEQALQERGPFSPPEVAAIGIDVCRALAAVHDAGLLHRDVKAQNVMQDVNGRRVLMDFGAGRHADASGESDLSGTPLYLAPEVIDGQPASVSSDIYSVGVLLFHLVSGVYPVEGKTVAELRTLHAGRRRPHVRAVRPDCPEALASVIERALSPRAADRFETAEAMATAAAQFVGSARSGAKPMGSRWLAGALVIALLGTAWFVGARHTNTDSEVRTRLVWDDAIDLEGSTTADGRLLSFADWETGNLAVRDLTLGHSTAVTKSGYAAGGEVEHTAFAPDGRWIAYSWLNDPPTPGAPATYELRVINADGTQDRVLRRADSEHTYWQPEAWSPDGQWIASSVATRHGWTIELVSRDGAKVRTVATLGKPAPTAIRVSPDGRWLGFHQGTSVFILPFDGSSGAPRAVADAARFLAWTADGRLLFTRERSGSAEVYVLPVRDDHAAGEPVRLDNVADMGPALGLTASGALIYGKTKSSTDAISIAIDPDKEAIGSERIIQPVEVYGFGAGGVRYSPDGTRVLYTPRQGSVLIRSFDGASRTLVPQLERVGRVEWAADSRSLIVAGVRNAGERGVYRVDLNTGVSTLLVGRTPSQTQLTAYTLSPDGRTLYSGNGFYPNVAVIARDLQTGVEREMRKLKDGVVALAVSRDGRRLAIVTFPTLEVMDLSTGMNILSVDVPKDSKFLGGDWSPDGRYVFAPVSFGNVRVRGELWRIGLDGGAAVRHPLSAPAHGASMRPDGKELSMVHWEERQQVWVIENFLPAAK